MYYIVVAVPVNEGNCRLRSELLIGVNNHDCIMCRKCLSAGLPAYIFLPRSKREIRELLRSGGLSTLFSTVIGAEAVPIRPT